MKLPQRMREALLAWAWQYVEDHDPDFTVMAGAEPYLVRRYVIARNPIANVYLHTIWKSDDDRALHDHPWPSCSIIIDGGYTEVTPRGRYVRRAGDVVTRGPWAAHRLELAPNQYAVTLFLTGPRLRTWGFHCPQGWRPWNEFVSSQDTGRIGRGCE